MSNSRELSQIAAAVTVDTSKNVSIAEKITVTKDSSISGLTVGKGGGAVATNVTLGQSALANGSNTGADIVAVGRLALNANSSGGFSVAVGSQALYTNTTGSGSVAVGYAASYLNTTGSNNTAIGQSALQSNTTASNNTAVGYQAGYSNTTGTQNTFVGYFAGLNKTTADYNTVLGSQAFRVNATGNDNTIIGATAGYVLTGSNNTFVGARATTTYGCGELVTTGSKNTIIGGYNGNQGGLDIRTASNYIVLSDGDGNPNIVSVFTGSIFSTHFGIAASSYGGNAVIVPTYNGNSQPAIRSYDVDTVSRTNNFIDIRRNGTTVGSIQTTLSATSFNTSSDYRLKENIAPMAGALAKVAQLKPCTYVWKATGETSQGFIAHELQGVVPECVTGEKDAVNEDGSIKPQGIDTSFLVATLTAAIQELNAKVEAQALEIATLKGN